MTVREQAPPEQEGASVTCPVAASWMPTTTGPGPLGTQPSEIEICSPAVLANGLPAASPHRRASPGE